MLRHRRDGSRDGKRDDFRDDQHQSELFEVADWHFNNAGAA